MQFSDQYWLPSTAQQTWNALHDPDLLKYCIRGCTQLERLSETEYAITVEARSRGVSNVYQGRILLSDRQPPHRVHAAFEGTGEHADLVIGHVDIELQPVPQGGTRLCYKLHVATGGSLAELDEDILAKLGRRYVERFFARFTDHLARHAASYTPPPPAPEADPPTAARIASLRSWLALLALIVLVTAYYVLLRD